MDDTLKYVEDQSLTAAQKLLDLGAPDEVISLFFAIRAMLTTETFDETTACMEPFLSWRLADAYTSAVTALVQP